MIDSSTSAAQAAHRADGISLAALATQEDRLLADVAGAFDPREGMDFRSFVEIDRAVLGVDHRQRMDVRTGRNVNVLQAAADRLRLFDRPLDAAAAERPGNRPRVAPDWPARDPMCSSTRRRDRAHGAARFWPIRAAIRANRFSPCPNRIGRCARRGLHPSGPSPIWLGPVAGRFNSGGLDAPVDQEQIVAGKRLEIVHRAARLRAVNLGHVRRHEARPHPSRRIWR